MFEDLVTQVVGRLDSGTPLSGSWAALVVGLTWGVVTSIPLGPTGALVLECASRNNRRGIYLAVGGFALGHLVFQAIYHLGIGALVTSHQRALSVWAAPGVVMMVVFGLRHIRTGSRLATESLVTEPLVTESPEAPGVSHRGLRPVSAGEATPAQDSGALGESGDSRSWGSVGWRSLSLALLNPVLLLYMILNTSVFTAAWPHATRPQDLVVLLMAALIGTVVWFVGFGEVVLRRSAGWGPRQRAWAERITGLLLMTAGVLVALKLWV